MLLLKEIFIIPIIVNVSVFIYLWKYLHNQECIIGIKSSKTLTNWNENMSIPNSEVFLLI